MASNVLTECGHGDLVDKVQRYHIAEVDEFLVLWFHEYSCAAHRRDGCCSTMCPFIHSRVSGQALVENLLRARVLKTYNGTVFHDVECTMYNEATVQRMLRHVNSVIFQPKNRFCNKQ